MARSADNDLTDAVLATVRRWQAGAPPPFVCPACGAVAAIVEDRSARPHAEWYALTCSACGVETVVQLPLGSMPVPIGG